MGKQVFNIVGMSRDLDPAKSENNHAYEIRNLRLTAQEDSTLLALTTEKGNSQYELTNPIEGKIVGYCVVGTKYLVIFSHSPNRDYIYRLEELGEALTNTQIYNGLLGFTDKTKLETLGVYENEDIQRVYWIDGIHQPRVINIVADEEAQEDWLTESNPFDFIPALALNEKFNIEKVDFAGIFSPGTIQYAFSYLKENGQQSNLIYISPIYYIAQEDRGGSPEETISNSFKITINNLDTNFDYINIYSIQRTSENGTPVCRRVVKTKLKDASPGIEFLYNFIPAGNPVVGTPITEPIVLFSKSIERSLTQRKFDLEQYLVSAMGDKYLYEIPMATFTATSEISPIPMILYNREDNSYREYHYEGLNPNFKVSLTKELIEEEFVYTIRNINELTAHSLVNITKTEVESINKQIVFIDSGITGEVVDYSEILYLNNGAIVPQTMAAKNNKLFFGNYEYQTKPLDIEGLSEILKDSIITFAYADKPIPKGEMGNFYMYDSSLNLSQADISSFKGGETYTFGVILQDKNGVWSSVIPINTVINNLYPRDLDTKFYPVKAYITISDRAKNLLSDYKNIKIVRRNQLNTVIAQGALCPTVYRFNDRKEGSIYSRASWFFRPINKHPDTKLEGSIRRIDETNNQRVPYNTHNCNIPTSSLAITRSEIISASNTIKSVHGLDDNNIVDSDFFIDSNILTLNSPECEFSTFDTSNLNIRIIGVLPLTSSRSWLFTQVENPNTFFTREYEEGNKATISFENCIENKNKVIPDINLSSLFNKPEVNIINEITGIYGNIITSACPIWDYTYKSARVNNQGEAIKTDTFRVNSLVYPWHRDTSLTNQLPIEGSESWCSKLKTKCISNLRTARKTLYLNTSYKLNPISIETYRDDSQLLTLDKAINNGDYTGDHIYKGFENDLLLTGEYSLWEYINNSYLQKTKNYFGGENPIKVKDPVLMKYKSAPHLVFNLSYNQLGQQYILPKFKSKNASFGDRYTENLFPSWGNRKNVSLEQGVLAQGIINEQDLTIQENGIIYLAECYIEKPNIPDIKQEGFIWEVCSEAQSLNSTTYIATIGDTYYQRYDCLKTYPNSFEDTNQVAEIFSFMCESRINIDGRYDKRRGQPNNTLVSPTNFNLLNKAYSQKDNFFSYPYLKDNKYLLNKFPNQILWTLNKVLGEDVDTWTHIVPTASIDADGTLGEITSIKLWNDHLICFQDRGISQIMYNERAAISTEQGIPIELASSNAVTGISYISNKVGCSNKYTIQVTQDGIYFIDSNNKEFYKWSQGLESISKNKGFNTYFYDLDINSIETFYDPKLKDIYLSLPKSDTERQCLVYSEQLGEFTSFFDYDLDYLIPFNNSLVSIKDNTLWKQFNGDYLTYFGIKQSYSIDVISADKPLEDKIFTNIEFRSECFNGENNQVGLITTPTSSIIPTPLPFDSIKAWNTYQEGNSLFSKSMSKTSNISRKFRIWRADIPRVDNTVIERIRSPWARIKLTKNASNLKTVIHDLVVTYY